MNTAIIQALEQMLRRLAFTAGIIVIIGVRVLFFFYNWINAQQEIEKPLAVEAL